MGARQAKNAPLPQEKFNSRTSDMLIFNNVAPYIVGKYEGFSLYLDFLKRLFALGFNVCDMTSTKIRKTNREQKNAIYYPLGNGMIRQQCKVYCILHCREQYIVQCIV